jgi:hypothetical protein
MPETKNRSRTKIYDPVKYFISGIFKATENYSNVPRGSGHHSAVSSKLYEHVREMDEWGSGIDVEIYEARPTISNTRTS